MKICIFGSASDNIADVYFSEAERFGRLAAQRGHCVYFGGGTHGVMGAAVRGILAEGGESVGVAPAFFDHGDILCKDCSEFILTDTLHERIAIFERESDCFAVLPGGVGTYQEFFDVLASTQLGQLTKPIALLNTNGYFDPLLALLKHTAQQGFLAEKSLALFCAFDSCEQMMHHLEGATSNKN